APSPAAGDVDQRACRIGRGIAQEPNDGFGDFLRMARSSHGCRGTKALCPVGLSAARMDTRIDTTGPGSLHAPTLAGELFRESDGQRIEGALRSGIVDEFEGGAQPGSGGG